MKRYAATIDLVADQEKISEYLAHHRAVWVEVVGSFRAVGVLDIRIWRHQSRMFYEMDVVDDFDPARDFARYAAAHPSNPIWEHFMTSFQKPLDSRADGEHWAAMDLAFSLADHVETLSSKRGIRVDSHQHFWNFNTEEFGWIDESMSDIARSFLPNDLQPKLSAQSIHGCVAVQARCSDEETTFLLELANQHAFILGVVGWVDLCAVDLEEKLASYRGQNRLVGFREILQGKPAEAFLKPEFIRGLATLHRLGYAYDLLVFANQLDDAHQLLSKISPEQRVILDHLGKPDVKNAEFKSWQEQIFRLAKDFPNLHVKLSGMVTEAAWNAWKLDDFRPYAETLLNAFGVERVCYGSDWPVCLVAAKSYAETFDLAAQLVSHLDAPSQAKIFGENAQRFYQLPPVDFPVLSE